MNMWFVPTGGRPRFKMEVGCYDSVYEIKAKIQRYQGIPVSDIHDLIIGDIILDEFDDLCISEYCGITEHSVIQVTIFKKPPNKNQRTVKLLVKMPVSGFWEEVVVDLVDDTVKKLKDKIRRFEELDPGHSVYLFVNDSELEEDEKSLSECQLYENRRVTVSLHKEHHDQDLQDQDQPVDDDVVSVSNVGTEGISAAEDIVDHVKVVAAAKELKVEVMLFGEDEKIPVEVNGGDAVEELRKELDKMKGRVALPENGYLFMHNRHKMEEEQSFRWHDIADGDTIEVFPEEVTSEN